MSAAVLAAAVPALALADPLTVIFPTLDMQAQTEPIEVQDGQLGAPLSPDNLGLYALDGNLVLVGHVDWNGQRRVLSLVRSFDGGEPIWLSDGRTYHVVWTRTLPADTDTDSADWADVFAPADDVLTLITCSGPFSLSRHEYMDRTVIRAVRDD